MGSEPESGTANHLTGGQPRLRPAYGQGTILRVEHRTAYRYRRPVSFGEHRLMLRPRDSHDLRLLETGLLIQPAASVRWLHDPFGNSVAIARFETMAEEMVFESSFLVAHYPIEPGAIELEPEARRYPFAYTAEEMPDLEPCIARHYPDPHAKVALWARSFLGCDGTADTLTCLTAMNAAIRRDFEYTPRWEIGTRSPEQTLELRSGTCRDYALLMMEAVRSLGFAARFVSGYLYDETLIGRDTKRVGGGETHAWLEIYLPGAGWVEFDPTNALVAGRNLIRVAVARDPARAVPLSGTFFGGADDFLGMDVTVQVSTEPAEMRSAGGQPRPEMAE